MDQLAFLTQIEFCITTDASNRYARRSKSPNTNGIVTKHRKALKSRAFDKPARSFSVLIGNSDKQITELLSAAILETTADYTVEIIACNDTGDLREKARSRDICLCVLVLNNLATPDYHPRNRTSRSIKLIAEVKMLSRSPIIALSGWNRDVAHSKKAKRAGASFYFRLPFNFNALVAAVQCCLKERHDTLPASAAIPAPLMKERQKTGLRRVADTRIALNQPSPCPRLPSEGIYFVVRLPNCWELKAFLFSKHHDSGHAELWENHVTPMLVYAWAPLLFIGINAVERQRRERLLRSELNLHYDGFPRGRVTQMGSHKRFVVYHGGNLNTAMKIKRQDIESAFGITGCAAWKFDEHEQCSHFSAEGLRSELLLRDKWKTITAELD